ncbi:MAG: 2-oxoglutarate dehydrogenase complex dihydrolipoyllysine-residue succinyltransferase, partial [bacterium]
MSVEIIIPSPGESVTQVQLARWLVHDGDFVDRDQEVVEIDSDKASFPLAAPESGTIKIAVPEGETIAVGAVIAVITPGAGSRPQDKPALSEVKPVTKPLQSEEKSRQNATPLAKKIMEENKLDSHEVSASFPGKKITRKEIAAFLNRKQSPGPALSPPGSRSESRKKLTTLRLKLAERLVAVKNETAMLTTFNEVNMKAIIRIKEKLNETFKERYGAGIGFMSFFTKAVTIALREFPQVNSMIDGDELITPDYTDIGIAVSAPKGLVVPVIRNAEGMSIPELELKIEELAVRARDNKLTIDEMKGGTFTITNGGVFGSMMSTPILNPPQSAILGMHKIMERPVAIDGQVVIAPMMYVALSYDHRVIDGRESVSFLVRVKEIIEDPVKMLTEGQDPVKL